MGINPNSDNYTIPGGIKLYFSEDGVIYRHLGNLSELDLEPGADKLDHFSSLSGKRTKDKSVIIEETLTLNFTLDECNAENIRYFFRGGDLVNVGEGTDTIVDRKVTVNGILFVPVGDYYGLSAVTVRTFLDYFLVYDDDGSPQFTDQSAEADSVAGTPFEIFNATADFIYMGKATQFKEVYFNVQTAGAVGARDWEYWNGSEWFNLAGIGGTGEDFSVDGDIFWTLPGDWALTTVNELEAYWVRCKVASVTTPPTVVSAGRQNLTVNVDYTLDVGLAGATGRQEGRIARLAAGILTTAEEVKISFTYTTWISQKMAIASEASVEGAARLEVQPSAGRGHRFDVVFGRCSIKNKGSIKFDDKDWLKIPMVLEGLDNSSADPTYPYGYVQFYGTL